FFVVNRHYRVATCRLRAGIAAVKRSPEPSNSVVLYVDRLDPATKLAAWYAEQITDHGYHPGWVAAGKRRPDPGGQGGVFTGGGTRIEALEHVGRQADAVLDYVWSLPRGESNFLTVIVPEQFERPPLLTEVLPRHTPFSLKFRPLK